jgi:hypothetical protein
MCLWSHRVLLFSFAKLQCSSNNSFFIRAFANLDYGTLKRYSKALEYEYRVKTAALGTLKRYFILSLTLYLEWYSAYSTVGSGEPHWLKKEKNVITHKPKIQIKFRLHH